MRHAGLRRPWADPDHDHTRPAGLRSVAKLVKRQFHPEAPNQLWVADITYVATWSGFAFVTFVTDACTCKFVGWNVSCRLSNEGLPLQALEMASWSATADLTGLVHHADHGSQYLSLRYSSRLADLGIHASTGSVGASYDNALAGTINGLFKTELINHASPGAPSRRSNSRPWNGSGGSTPRACTPSSTTAHPHRSRGRPLRSTQPTEDVRRQPRKPLGTKPRAVQSHPRPHPRRQPPQRPPGPPKGSPQRGGR